MSKLFSFDASEPQAGRGDGEATWSEDISGLMDGTGSDAWSMALRQLEPGDLFLDWESLNISQWDNFPFPASVPGPGPSR